MSCTVPISLFAVIIDTSKGFCFRASLYELMFTRPLSSTGRYIICKPSFSRRLHDSSTQGCSICVVIIVFFLRFFDSLIIVLKTVLFDSEPPEVNNISSLFFAPIRSAICLRAISKAFAERRPSSCKLDAFP